MKKHTKLVASLVVAGALALAPVAAQAYPVEPPAAPVVSGTAAPGATITVTFSGFEPGEMVTVTMTGENAAAGDLASIVRLAVTSEVETYTAAADGTVFVTATLPADASGQYTITAVGAESALSQTATVTVAAAGGGGGTAAGGGGLAATGGQDLTGLWIGGGALLLTGGAVLVATKLRRRSDEADA